MRLLLSLSFTLILAVSAAQAQSIMDNLPPAGADSDSETEAPTPASPVPPTSSNPAAPVAEPFTVADVGADVTADTAAHARDQALMQAERAAYTQLCARMGVPDNNLKLNDDALAGLVQSFEVQSERLSAVRYIGVFTIRFKPAATQKRIGKPLTDAATATSAAPDDAKPMPTGPLSHLTIAVQADSLAAFTQIKRRINAAPPVALINVLDLGRGLSHIDLSYVGSVGDLQQALTAQGLVLRQNQIGIWQLYDGSMVSR